MTDHGKEETELWVQVHIVAVSEDELRLALLLAGQHDGNLLSGHRQHRQLNAVELVETAPGTRLSQTCQHTKSKSPTQSSPTYIMEEDVQAHHAHETCKVDQMYTDGM